MSSPLSCGKWLSRVGELQQPLGGLLKHVVLPPLPQVPDSIGMSWSSRPSDQGFLTKGLMCTHPHPTASGLGFTSDPQPQIRSHSGHTHQKVQNEKETGRGEGGRSHCLLLG